MSEGRFFVENPESQVEKRARYFASLEAKYPDQIKFLERVGGMVNKDAQGQEVPKGDKRDWTNVKEHCLTVVAAAEALSDALNLPPETKELLGKAGVVHDWYKRLRRTSQDAKTIPEIHKDAYEKNRHVLLDYNRPLDGLGGILPDDHEVQDLYNKIGVSPEFLSVTTPDYLDRGFIEKTATFEERLMSYLDAITNNSEIVPFEERLDKAAASPNWKDLATDEKWHKKLAPILGENAYFFDGQKAQETATQQEIFDLLQEQGFELGSPAEVPSFIKQQVEKNFT